MKSFVQYFLAEVIYPMFSNPERTAIYLVKHFDLQNQVLGKSDFDEMLFDLFIKKPCLFVWLLIRKGQFDAIETQQNLDPIFRYVV
ncbi:MAG: hypothetical protein HWD58_22150 [Bacteroidota bacterium]|nr:MAG: hypothetical protein HWD58_22150 [Bacteroidota bacterium]